MKLATIATSRTSKRLRFIRNRYIFIDWDFVTNFYPRLSSLIIAASNQMNGKLHGERVFITHKKRKYEV